MVAEEAHEALGRIVEHPASRGRPDAGRHRHQVAVAEGGAEARLVDEVADREIEILGPVEQLRGEAVEAQDVVGHAQERRPHDVAPLADIAFERTAVLEAPLVEADGERHVGVFGGHAQVVEQGDQVGIVALVEHDEADIDGARASGHRGVDSAGMTAEALLALVDDDFVLAAQQPGGAQSGDAGAHNGDLHSKQLPDLHYTYAGAGGPDVRRARSPAG